MRTSRAAGPLKAGVIGAGAFGTLHAKKYAHLADCELIGVHDPDPERGTRLADEFGVTWFDQLEALLQAVDVVTVASPAETHFAAADQALRAGCHVYVEKPLATTLQRATKLVERASASGLVLACGHQERAVFAAMSLLDAPERPTRIESVRRGTPNARNRDVSCVLDLMIHDLDLALAVGGGAPVEVRARGGFDEVQADATLAGGLQLKFQASRIAVARERTMRLEYVSGVVEIDFLAPAFANGAGFPLNPAFAVSPDGRDPLGASVSAFVAAVRGEAARPLVSGAEGLAALDLALAIQRGAGLG